MSREEGGRSSGGAGAGERTRPRSALSSSSPKQQQPQQQQQQQQQQQELYSNYDDSFSEERITMHSSWESVDSSSEQQHQQKQQNRPSSGFRPDRRRQFDATTPTLVDEDDCEEEILSLEQQVRLRSFEQKPPTASSSTTTTVAAAFEDLEIRRTPGATAMHRSFQQDHETSVVEAAATTGIEQRDVGGSLGYALTLSTPISAKASSSTTAAASTSSTGASTSKSGEQQEHSHQHSKGEASITRSASGGNRESSGQSGGWETYAAAAERKQSPTQQHQQQEPGDQQTLVPTHVSSASEGGGVFSFPSSLPEQHEQRQIQRQGAFSPGLLRLTEDIGNLLQEDEDDDYTIEIPSVFRSEGGEATGADLHSTTTTAPSADWTGSFMIERNKTFAKRTPVTRVAAPPGRTRRVRGGGGTSSSSSAFSAQQQHPNVAPAASFMPNAQHPIPRRSGNEVFEFGKSHDERDSSPQLLNFGGAFAPLAKTTYGEPSEAAGETSSFTRPVAYAQAPPPPAFSFQPQMPMQHQQSHPPPTVPSFQLGYHAERTASASIQPPPGAPGIQQPLFHAHSFDSYQSGGAASATAPYGFASQSPATMVSDMQATAQEFVPMATRSTTPMLQSQVHQQPQQPPPHWSQQHPPPTSSSSPYDVSSSATPTSFVAPVASSSYHHPAHGGFSFGYGIQQQPPPLQSSASLGQVDAHRAAMTPSPHLPVWHQQPPSSLPSSTQQQRQQQQPGGSVSSSSPLPFHGTAGSLLQHPSSSRAQTSTGAQQPSSVPSSTSQSGLASASSVVDPSLRGAGGGGGGAKKELKRVKRGKKKSSQGNTTSTTVTTGTGGTKSEATATAGKKISTSSGKSKKKQTEQVGRPGSTATHGSQDVQGEDAVSASDDPGDQRRMEPDESPATRLAFKEFYKAYRSKEQLGVQEAEAFATQSLQDGSLPESIHWRVYVELADLARRSNRFAEARRLYQKVCQIQPYASQGWVEYSKLEEECGNMNRVTNILHAGLEYCEYNENLLIKAVKHQERMGNMDRARALLARLKHIGIDKVWRTMLEGAMFEARAGNIVMARRVLKYIMHHVPWYGPLYVEFYRLERDHGHPLDALDVVQWGLSQIPRYGPLWFSALRVCEQLDFADKNFYMPKTTAMLQRASVNVNKEITWKVHLEASFIFERAAQEQALHNDGLPYPYLGPARHFFSLTIRSCRLNLRWKVWLAAARMELCAGNTEKARPLFLRAHQVAPEKVRSLTFLDYARLHEFTGEAELARAILCKGRYEYGHDWKVWLESVLLEMRGFNLRRAFELASRALDVHHGTGRLWASLVQLSQYSGGDEAQYKALRSALNAVPKSGEVWCEGARIHLNPFSDVFNLGRARRHLFFAGKFTPQYGDSFLEIVRLELLDQWLAPISDYIWEKTKSGFSPSEKANKFDCLTKYITDVTLAISVASTPGIESKNVPALVHEQIVETVRRRLKREEYEKSVDLSSTILSCSNVDPNYGPLWFNCRRIQTDPPRRVVEHAAECMVADLQKCAHVYLAAMIRRKVILSTIKTERPQVEDENDIEVFDSSVMEWEDHVDKVLRTFPSLGDIFNPVDPTTGLVLLESTLGGSDFVTGLMEFNKYRPIDQMSLADRKRAVFATDALFP